MKNLIDQATRWAKESAVAYEKETGEEVTLGVSIQTFPEPDPSDPEGVVARPGLVIYLEIPGPTPETHCFISNIIRPVLLTRETVKDSVERGIKLMRDERDSHLTTASVDS